MHRAASAHRPGTLLCPEVFGISSPPASPAKSPPVPQGLRIGPLRNVQIAPLMLPENGIASFSTSVATSMSKEAFSPLNTGDETGANEALLRLATDAQLSASSLECGPSKLLTSAVEHVPSLRTGTETTWPVYVRMFEQHARRDPHGTAATAAAAPGRPDQKRVSVTSSAAPVRAAASPTVSTTYFLATFDPKQGLDCLRQIIFGKCGLPVDRQTVYVHCKNTTFHVYSQKFDLHRLLATNEEDMLECAAWIQVEEDDPALKTFSPGAPGMEKVSSNPSASADSWESGSNTSTCSGVGRNVASPTSSVGSSSSATMATCDVASSPTVLAGTSARSSARSLTVTFANVAAAPAAGGSGEDQLAFSTAVSVVSSVIDDFHPDPELSSVSKTRLLEPGTDIAASNPTLAGSTPSTSPRQPGMASGVLVRRRSQSFPTVPTYLSSDIVHAMAAGTRADDMLRCPHINIAFYSSLLGKTPKTYFHRDPFFSNPFDSSPVQ